MTQGGSPERIAAERIAAETGVAKGDVRAVLDELSDNLTILAVSEDESLADPIIEADVDDGPDGECRNGQLACAGPAAFDLSCEFHVPICRRCADEAAGLSHSGSE